MRRLDDYICRSKVRRGDRSSGQKRRGETVEFTSLDKTHDKPIL